MMGFMSENKLLVPTARPLAELTPENLKRLIEDMGSGPGWYASSALYIWYVGMCRADGLEPVSVKKFGMVLSELGYRRVNQRVDGKMTRGWFISMRALRGLPPREPRPTPPLPDGYWGTVSIVDVDAMLEELGEGEHHWTEVWSCYARLVESREWPLCIPAALAGVLRNKAYRERVVRTGAKTFRILTVKCQDDAEAEMSPEAVG